MIYFNIINERVINISADESLELLIIMQYLTVRRKEKSFSRYKATEYVENIYKYYSQVNDKQLIIQRGTFDLVTYLLDTYDIKYIVDENITKFERIEVLPKWYEILTNSKFNDTNNIYQYQYLYQLLSYNIGIGKFPTGYGKTELQIAIVDSYQNRFQDGNVLIIAPTDLIKENFVERFSKWGVLSKTIDNSEEVSISKNIDVNRRINLINPTGLLSTSAYKNKEEKLMNWLANVRCCVIDECHKCKSTTWTKFCINQLKNCKYLYSFSATPDATDHITPYFTNDISKWGDNIMNVVGITGITRVEVFGTNINKNITFDFINGKWSNLAASIASVKRSHMSEAAKQSTITELLSYMTALDSTLMDDNFISELHKFLLKHRNRTFYMLLHKIETAGFLRHMLCELLDDEYSVILIDSSGVTPRDIGSVTNLKDRLKDDLHNRTKLIISTTAGAEGMDIGHINGVITVIGKNAKLTLQTIGRSRDKDTLVVFVNDYGNPVLLKHNNEKKKFIRQEYGVDI